MKLTNDNFIGIFDSGIGGISVLNSCIDLMPYENYVYFADTKNFPYGKKTKTELENIGLNVISKLYDRGSNEIVIACNTMSTSNMALFQQTFKDIKIIGTFPDLTPIFQSNLTISEKLISYDKANGLHISNNKIKLLIIATTATTKSKYLKDLVRQFDGYIDIYVEPANFIVKAVENDYLNSDRFISELESLLKEYENTDYILLGCTHFVFAVEKIKLFVNNNVKFLTGGDIAANIAYINLHDNNLLNGNTSPYIKIVDYNIDNNKIELYNKLLKPSAHTRDYYAELP